MAWRANTDFAPCTNEHGVSDYLGKYAAKAEPSSEPFKEMFAKLLPFVSRNNSHHSVSKCVNRVVGERDWSAQEVCHVLLGRPLVDMTRQIVTLDYRPGGPEGHAGGR